MPVSQSTFTALSQSIWSQATTTLVSWNPTVGGKRLARANIEMTSRRTGTRRIVGVKAPYSLSHANGHCRRSSRIPEAKSPRVSEIDGSGRFRRCPGPTEVAKTWGFGGSLGSKIHRAPVNRSWRSCALWWVAPGTVHESARNVTSLSGRNDSGMARRIARTWKARRYCTLLLCPSVLSCTRTVPSCTFDLLLQFLPNLVFCGSSIPQNMQDSILIVGAKEPVTRSPMRMLTPDWIPGICKGHSAYHSALASQHFQITGKQNESKIGKSDSCSPKR